MSRSFSDPWLEPAVSSLDARFEVAVVEEVVAVVWAVEGIAEVEVWVASERVPFEEDSQDTVVVRVAE